MTNVSFLAIAPELIVTAAVVALLLVDVQWRPGARWWALYAGFGLAGGLAASIIHWIDYRGADAAQFFRGMIVVDGFSALAGIVIFSITGLALIVAWPLVRSQGGRGAEFVVLVLIAATGAHLMAAAANLVMLFIALEVF